MDTKKLRQKILDLAIHGKLVPQDPNDEPASVLLERIRKEKELLIKEGKIKAPKKSKSAGDTSHYPKDVPFEVPEGWCWRYLSDIGTWQSGATPSRGVKSYFGGSIPWLKTGDLNDDYVKDIPERITDKALKETSVKLNPEGSVLIAMYGATIGKVGILNFPATTNQACCACSELCGVDNRFLFYFLISHKEEFIRQAGGGAQPNISKEIIVNTPIPVPPAEEQKRIVSEIEKWLGVLKDIDKSSLFIHTGINNCKARILDLAIHGKLVPQDPSDEPAIELLKRINPGFVPSDNLHYCSMPRGWCECRLQDCVEILNGYAFKSNEYTGEGIRVIRITNVQSGTISDEDPKFFPAQRSHEIDRYLLKEGDLLMSLTGNVGRVAFLEKSMLPAALNQRVACLRSPLPSEVLMFIFYFCQTKEFANACVSSGKGVAQLNISTEWLKDYRISLPPINEIRRIIKAVRKHLILLEEIANI